MARSVTMVISLGPIADFPFATQAINREVNLPAVPALSRLSTFLIANQPFNIRRADLHNVQTVIYMMFLHLARNWHKYSVKKV